MRQILMGGGTDPLNSVAGTEYTNLINNANNTWAAGELQRQQIITASGRLSNLRIYGSTTPGGTGVYTFTVRINTADSNLTCALNASDTNTYDLTNFATVSAGDMLAIKCVTSGAPANTPYIKWSLVFEGDNQNEFVIVNGASGSSPSNTVNTTSYLQHGGTWSSTAVGTLIHSGVFSKDGIAKNFYINLTGAPGVGKQWTLNYIFNSATVPIVISGTSTTGSDTSTNVTISAADVGKLQAIPSGTPTRPIVRMGCSFFSQNSFESVLLGGTQDTLPAAGKVYCQLGNAGNKFDATESNMSLPSQIQTIYGLNIVIKAAPGAGNGYQFTVMLNGASTDLTATVSDTNTTASNTTDYLQIQDGDLLSMEVQPINTPTATSGAAWGVVCRCVTPHQNSMVRMDSGI